jgi:hypothetical protein
VEIKAAYRILLEKLKNKNVTHDGKGYRILRWILWRWMGLAQGQI